MCVNEEGGMGVECYLMVCGLVYVVCLVNLIG